MIAFFRSTDVDGEHVYWPSDNAEDEEQTSKSERITSTRELDYVKILNAVLPPTIRLLAWAPMAVDFNARHNCVQRAYKYVFPRANLDIQVCSYLQ